MDALNRFYSYVKKTSSCWIWQGSKNKFGHGMFSFNGKTLGAHRFSAQIAGYNIENKCVCHRCDNPSCVNPKHLFVGTQQDNMIDKSKKGRATGSNGKNGKKIQTPDGIFESRLAAAKHYGIDPSSIGKRMVRYPRDYYYIL